MRRNQKIAIMPTIGSQLIHTGGAGYSRSKSRWTWPEWVEEVGVDLPELRILMGHTNLQTPFETGAYWRGLTAAQGKANIYLDLCDWQGLGAVQTSLCAAPSLTPQPQAWRKVPLESNFMTR